MLSWWEDIDIPATVMSNSSQRGAKNDEVVSERKISSEKEKLEK
jgi:hypothetical protein